MKRNIPSTSKEAYKSAKLGLIDGHKQKIISAMQVVGIANYEVIAAKAGLDRHACMRRLSELERDEIIYKPGTKSPTKSGCMAMNYCLTTANQQKVEKPSHKEEEAVHNFAKDVINTTKQLSLL